MGTLAESTRESEFVRYARVVRRRWRIGFIAMLVVLGIFAAISFAQSSSASYSTSTELVVRFGGNDATFPPAPDPSISAIRVLEAEVDIAKSDGVRTAAAEAVGESFDFDVTLAPTTSRLVFTATGPTAEVSAERASAAADAYRSERRLLDLNGVSGREDNATARLERARAALDAHEAQVAELVAAVEDAATPEETEAARQQLTAFEDRNLGTAAALGTAVDDAEVALAAVAPTIEFFGDPANFSRVQVDGASTAASTSSGAASTLVRALLLGAVVGGLVMFLLDYFDDTVRDENELVLKLDGVPLLGAIPFDDHMASDAESNLVGPDTPAGESILSIVNALEFVQGGAPARSIVLAGMSPGDGRSAIAVNLAVAMARLGRSAVLVDLNVRDPSIHRTFSIENDWGITNCVLANVGLAQLMVPVPALGGLMVLPAGPRPQAPAEMVKSPRTAAVLEALSTHYDHVIVDAPALSEASDVLSIAPYVDGVVLVGRSGSLRRRDLAALLRKLRQLNVTIVGAINNATPSPSRASRSKRPSGPPSLGSVDGAVSPVRGLAASNGSGAAVVDVGSTPMPVRETAEQQPITVGVAGNGSAASNGSGSDDATSKSRRSRARKRSDTGD